MHGHNGFASTGTTPAPSPDRSSCRFHQLAAWLGCRNTLHCSSAPRAWLRALRSSVITRKWPGSRGPAELWPTSLGSMWAGLWPLELPQCNRLDRLAHRPGEMRPSTQVHGGATDQPVPGPSSFPTAPYGWQESFWAHRAPSSVVCPCRLRKSPSPLPCPSCEPVAGVIGSSGARCVVVQSLGKESWRWSWPAFVSPHAVSAASTFHHLQAPETAVDVQVRRRAHW